MKVRTFALVIDWKKIDSRSGVQLGDNSQSSLGRKDSALFFSPRFLAKVTPAERSHIFGLVVAFYTANHCLRAGVWLSWACL